MKDPGKQATYKLWRRTKTQTLIQTQTQSHIQTQIQNWSSKEMKIFSQNWQPHQNKPPKKSSV